jgi:hypothetical protein
MIEFDILEKEGLILIQSTDDTFEDFTIDKAKFWRWVVSNELNAYFKDYHDPMAFDGHGQDSGHLSEDEYFDIAYKQIKSDLIKYLTTKNLIK